MTGDPVHTGMDSIFHVIPYKQVQELVGNMAGWVDDLDCGTWALLSAFETLL